ncbi:hypothetical protein P692DRAFT_20721124 [Suillus brevipes Sb2]|nr:hypothetical protein P692DRAFT_20721124 [Suillus brevipes Sb2]
MFQKKAELPNFSRNDVLRTVAEFVVCDDQSLAVVNKATFRNCLVAMRPSATKADIPSTHDITVFIHNSFLDFFKQIKSEIQVSHVYFYKLH